MKSDQVIDAVQTIGIITIAIVLSYVVVRLEGTLNLCADRLKKVLRRCPRNRRIRERLPLGSQFFRGINRTSSQRRASCAP